jgi:hypothetical protein
MNAFEFKLNDDKELKLASGFGVCSLSYKQVFYIDLKKHPTQMWLIHLVTVKTWNLVPKLNCIWAFLFKVGSATLNGLLSFLVQSRFPLQTFDLSVITDVHKGVLIN